MMRKIKAKSWKEEMGPENKKRLPDLHLSKENLPEGKDWEIGKKYKVALELVMTGKHEEDGHGNFSFDMMGVEVMPMPKQDKVKRYAKDKKMMEEDMDEE